MHCLFLFLLGLISYSSPCKPWPHSGWPNVPSHHRTFVLEASLAGILCPSYLQVWLLTSFRLRLASHWEYHWLPSITFPCLWLLNICLFCFPRFPFFCLTFATIKQWELCIYLVDLFLPSFPPEYNSLEERGKAEGLGQLLLASLSDDWLPLWDSQVSATRKPTHGIKVCAFEVHLEASVFWLVRWLVTLGSKFSLRCAIVRHIPVTASLRPSAASCICRKSADSNRCSLMGIGEGDDRVYLLWDR